MKFVSIPNTERGEWIEKLLFDTLFLIFVTMRKFPTCSIVEYRDVVIFPRGACSNIFFLEKSNYLSPNHLEYSI